MVFIVTEFYGEDRESHKDFLGIRDYDLALDYIDEFLANPPVCYNKDVQPRIITEEQYFHERYHG